MKTWRIAVVLAVVASVSWTMPARGQTLGLYDDFSSGTLDPLRWLGYAYAIGGTESRHVVWYGYTDWGGGNGMGPHNEATVRRVVDGQAQLALTSYRGLGPYRNDSFGAKGRNGLRMRHPALADRRPPVTTFSASVTVARVSVPLETPDLFCGPGDAGFAGAEIFGHFFNDGTSTGADDFTGDVFALVALDQRVDRTQQPVVVVRNVVEASIGRCENADCSRIRFLTTHRLGRDWITGVPHVLTIGWTPQTNAFTFTVAGGGVTESHTAPYTIADQERPRAYAYDLRLEAAAARCHRDAEVVPTRVSINARFDDVRLNSSAADAAAP
jgi:hypothetical protein